MVEWFAGLSVFWKIIIIIGYLCFAIACAGLTDLVNPYLKE